HAAPGRTMRWISAKSSSVSTLPAARTFSSRCLHDFLPCIGTVKAPRTRAPDHRPVQPERALIAVRHEEHLGGGGNKKIRDQPQSREPTLVKGDRIRPRICRQTNLSVKTTLVSEQAIETGVISVM